MPFERQRPQQAPEMLAAYKKGDSMESIARSFGVSYYAINRLCKENGVSRGTLEHRTPYACNHRFFSTASSNETPAYWAGFIGADGCVYADPRKGMSKTLIISLAEVDVEHLRIFASHCEASQLVRINEVKSGKWAGSNMATIAITSDILAKDLAGIGIIPRKTFVLPWPNLPREMLRHYLRGYFDGDGCWNLTTQGQWSMKIIGNMGFLIEAQKFLAQECSLRLTKIEPHPISPGIGSIRYCGNRQLRRIADFFYRDATVYLPRKYEKAKPFCSVAPLPL